jgi:hypothetical protein
MANPHAPSTPSQRPILFATTTRGLSSIKRLVPTFSLHLHPPGLFFFFALVPLFFFASTASCVSMSFGRRSDRIVRVTIWA